MYVCMQVCMYIIHTYRVKASFWFHASKRVDRQTHANTISYVLWHTNCMTYLIAWLTTNTYMIAWLWQYIHDCIKQHTCLELHACEEGLQPRVYARHAIHTWPVSQQHIPDCMTYNTLFLGLHVREDDLQQRVYARHAIHTWPDLKQHIPDCLT